METEHWRRLTSQARPGNQTRRLNVGAATSVMQSKAKTIRYMIEYAGFRFVGGVFAALPVETASALSGWLWRCVAPLFRRHARALAHLRLAFPEKSEAERQAIARAMWENLGRVFAEAFHLQEIGASDRIIVEPIETMRALSGKPTVACAPHIGNWDLTAFGLLRAGLRPATFYQRIKNPFVERYAARIRSPQFPGGLMPKTPDMPRRIMRYAREGGTVAFLADLRVPRGVDVPFFGTPARSTTFPALIARSCGAPLFAIHLVREPGVRFRFCIERIPLVKSADRHADIAAATAALQAAFERSIRSAPEQWMWAHRRWG